MKNSLSILIVDDEEELATLFGEFVRAMGLDSIYFTNPLLALENFKDNRGKFSLVITDLRMPGMDGLELSTHIRELNDSIKIFLVTVFDTTDLRNSAMYQSAKIDEVLQKPIKLSNLKKIIEETLNNSEGEGSRLTMR